MNILKSCTRMIEEINLVFKVFKPKNLGFSKPFPALNRSMLYIVQNYNDELLQNSS